MKRIVLGTIILAAGLIALASCGPRGGKKAADSEATATEMENNIIAEPEFDIITTHGTMRIKLYGKTPKHRDNFKKLVAEKYYDDIRKDWTAEAGKFKAYIGASSVDIRTVVPFVLE